MSEDNKPWRLIDSGPCHAFYNMALDEAIAQETMRTGAVPTLRLYGWDRPAVTLGRFQCAGEVDTDYCADNDIPFVRRPTGGRAILHGDELTYSFAATTAGGLFSGDLFKSYAALSAVFLTGFKLAGLDVQVTGRRKKSPSPNEQSGTKNPLCFSATSYGEITVEGKKIIGSAQRRWSTGMLQQGSIPFETDREGTADVFGSTHGADELIGLRQLNPKITRESLKDALVRGFKEALNITLEQSHPSPKEREEALRLVEQKYHGREWNYLK